MNTKLYQQLELIEPQPISSQLRQNIKLWLMKGVNAIAQFCRTNDEPVVTPSQELNGQRYWNIYDPMTEQTIYCMTETEALIWLDSHRY